MSFLSSIKDYEKEQIGNYMSHQFNERDGDYLSDFLIDGSFAIIVRWIKNGCERDVDEISNLITNTIKNMNFYFEK